MNKLLNIKSLAATIAVVAIGTMIALPTIGAAGDPENLTLTSIEADIVADNIAIKRAELAVDLQEEEVRVAKNDKIKAEGASLAIDMINRYNVRYAEMMLYIAEKDLEDTIESETLSAIESYYDYLLLTKEINNQNTEIIRLNEELAAVNKRIELGTATINSRTTKELEIATADYALSQLKEDKESLFLDLNLMLQQDLETILVIEEVNVPFEVYETEDILEDIAEVQETNQGIWQLEKQLDLDEIEIDILDKRNFSKQYSDQIDALENNVKQGRLDISDKKLSLEYDVRSQYNGLLNDYDSVKINELELDNLKITLGNLSKRYEVGFETENTVKVAEENVATAELELLQAKLDYYVAVETYKNFIN